MDQGRKKVGREPIPGVPARRMHRAGTPRTRLGSLDLGPLLDDIAGVVEGQYHALEIALLVIKNDCDRVVVHVGFDRGNVRELLDGRTGRRCGAASNDSGCAEDVGDGCRLRCAHEQEQPECEQPDLHDVSCSHS